MHTESFQPYCQLCFEMLSNTTSQGWPKTPLAIAPLLPFTQVGTNTDRQLIFIDRNRDLYVVPVMKRTPAKLASMCDSAAWHDTTGMLGAMVDQKLVRASRCAVFYSLRGAARLSQATLVAELGSDKCKAPILPHVVWQTICVQTDIHLTGSASST